jgi:hypothetical protein
MDHREISGKPGTENCDEKRQQIIDFIYISFFNPAIYFAGFLFYGFFHLKY